MDDGAMYEFGEFCDFWDGKQVTAPRNFLTTVSTDWAAVAKYIWCIRTFSMLPALVK